MSHFSFKSSFARQFSILVFCLLSTLSLFSKEIKDDSICRDCFGSALKYFYTNPDSALYFSQLIEKRANEIDNKKCLAIALSCYGTIYRNSGVYGKSIASFDSSLTLFKELNDSVWEARTILMISSVYSEKGDYLESINLLLEAARKYEGLTDEVSIKSRSRVKNHIGIAYYELGETENALRYFKEALADSEKLMDTSSFVSPLSNIAMIYSERGEYDEALVNYELARKVAVKINNRLNEAQILGNIGYTYQQKGNYDKAIEYRKKALKMVQQLNQKDEISKQFLGLANCYFLLKDYNQAILFSDSSYNLGKQIQAKSKVKEALELKIKIQLALKNDKALTPLFQELILYKDSLLTQEKVKQISALEIAFETEKKELTIANQEKALVILAKEKQLRNLYYVGFGVLFFLFSILIYMLYNRQKLKAKNAEMKEKLVQQELVQSELKNTHLQKDLDKHQQEITAITLSMIRKNDQIEAMKEQISMLDQNDSKAIELNRNIRENEIADIDWNNFNTHFSKIHPNFYDRLLEVNKSVTQSEMRTAALIKMNLSNREIASIIGVNIRSVDQAKYRLKKKIAEDSEENLVDLIRSF
tara:strand:+ start:4483 stop:6252 length:1770 start_codon:yes stop_codon:yes gene_type:complete